MANRTVQVYGQGYGADPALVTATYNGSQVFSGTVNTVNTPVPIGPQSGPGPHGELLFTFEIPVDFSGTAPMTVTVANSAVLFQDIFANFCRVPENGNAISSGSTGFGMIFRPKEADLTGMSDCRSNVVIDGVAQVVTPEQRGSLMGTWFWYVNSGSTMTYDLNVSPGLE